MSEKEKEILSLKETINIQKEQINRLKFLLKSKKIIFNKLKLMNK